MQNTCSNCGREHSYNRSRCHACHVYKLSHDEERPVKRRRRGKKMVASECPNCGKMHRDTSKLCHTCYQYQHKNGVARPPELWNRRRVLSAKPDNPSACDPDLCPNPATESRYVRLLSVTIELRLCPSCAAIQDRMERE